MKRRTSSSSVLIAAALFAAGCNQSTEKTNGNDAATPSDAGADAHVDAAPSGPLHVGATGDTSNLVTDGNLHAAYLLDAVADQFGNITGELHLASAGGTDVVIASGAAQGSYLLAPDGSALFFVTLTAGTTDAALNYLDLKTAGAMPKVVVATGYPAQSFGGPESPVFLTALADDTTFSPDGKYLLVGILAPGVVSSPDLHVIEVATGNDIYQQGNGAFDYAPQTLLLGNDTMIFQADALGAGTPAVPVQTLYSVSLAAPATPAVTLATRVGTFLTTTDQKTLVYLTTGNDLYAYTLADGVPPGTKLASNVASFSVGATLIATIGVDRSVTVLRLDRSAAVAVPAGANGADLFSPLVLSPDETDLYFFRDVDSQASNGTLVHLPVQVGAAPQVIDTAVSTADLVVAAKAILYLRNVRGTLDPQPDGGTVADAGALGSYPVTLFGDAVSAARDGTSPTPLGTTTPVGGLVAVTPPDGSWVVAHLDSAAVDATLIGNELPQPIDDGSTVLGVLGFAASALGGADQDLDKRVRQGAFAFSDDQSEVVYIGDPTLTATPPPDAGAPVSTGHHFRPPPTYQVYAGELHLFAAQAPTTMVSPGLAGVTEMGAIKSRALFVNAPKATVPGVYFVTY